MRWRVNEILRFGDYGLVIEGHGTYLVSETVARDSATTPR